MPRVVNVVSLPAYVAVDVIRKNSFDYLRFVLWGKAIIPERNVSS